jgi:biotin transport system substrate-specific component
MGFPVFAGGRGGIAHFLGPTGGYLLGYAFASLITGFISEHAKGLFVLEILAAVLGTLVIYAFGVPWLKVVGQIPWSKAWMVGALPFLPGDAIKGAVALGLARSVRPILTRHQQVLSS